MADRGNGRSPGRFLPPDPRVVEPYRLTPKLALRLAILGAVALGIFAILFLRLWALQVLSGEQYLRAAQNNRLRTVRVDAPRGVIRDRNGNILVGNVEGTAVQLWPNDLPQEGRWEMLKRLGRVLDVPPIRIARDVDRRRRDPLTPVVVKENIDRAELFYLSERAREFPGMELVKSHVRDYPYGKLAAHVLGHVGEVTESQLKRRAYAELVGGDKVGQAGVEAAFDRYLRGTAGLQRLLVDSLGQPRSDFTPLKTPMPGNNVTLTIDVGLQYAAERALEHGIRIARDSQCTGGCWNANGGAIVALDARNGEVLALASNPTFDPRIFVGKPNPWRIRPLVNEALREAQQLPGPEPRARGRLSARFDLQAGDGDRRARGEHRPAVRSGPVHARVHVRRRERCPLSVQELEPVHEHGDHDADRARVVLRHLLLPARGGVLRQAHVAAAGVGEPVRLRQGDGNRARARGNRPRADAEVASRHVR